MGKHRLDRTDDQAWGGPELTALADSDASGRHRISASDQVTAPAGRVAGDLAGPVAAADGDRQG